MQSYKQRATRLLERSFSSRKLQLFKVHKKLASKASKFFLAETSKHEFDLPS